MFLGLFRRPKEEADKIIYYQRFRRFPLGNPRGSAVEKCVDAVSKNDTE